MFYKSYMHWSDMDIQSQVKRSKGVPGVWMDINREQEYDTDPVLTGGNHHKQQVQGGGVTLAAEDGWRSRRGDGGEQV